MVRSRQLRAIRLAGVTRIPRRALFACLRGMTADEFDAFLEKTGARVSKRGPGTGLALSLMLFMAVHAVFMSVIPIITDELRTGFGLSGSQIGLLTSSYMMAFAVGSIPMGILGSRWGGRVLLGGTVVMALGAVLFAFSASYPWFLASRFLQGIGASTTLPVVNMLIAQAFPPEKRARSLGLFGAGPGLGVVVGLFSFPSLAERGGYRLVFLVAAGAALAVGLANLAQRAVRHHLPAQEPQSFSVLMRRSARMALNRRLLLLVVVNIGASGIIVGLVAWTPSFLHDMRGTGLAAAAYVSAGIGVAQLIGNPLGARAMTRWGKGPMYVVSLAVMAASAAHDPLRGELRGRAGLHPRRRLLQHGGLPRHPGRSARHGAAPRRHRAGHRLPQPDEHGRDTARPLAVRRASRRLRHGPGAVRLQVGLSAAGPLRARRHDGRRSLSRSCGGERARTDPRPG